MTHLTDLFTGWRRPLGCLKLQVIFRKRAANYRALLREMTYKDKTPYASLPPCTYDLESRRPSNVSQKEESAKIVSAGEFGVGLFCEIVV